MRKTWLLAAIAILALSIAGCGCELSRALARLLVVSENYPALRANQAFVDLRAQLEGTESRIAVARKRYIEAVQAYDVEVRSLPSNLTALALGFKPRPNFATEDDARISHPPTVDLGGPASGAAR